MYSARDLLSAHPRLVLFLLAAAARIGAVALLGHAMGGDTAQYRDAAAAIRGDPLDSISFPGLPPLYPLFLALIADDRLATFVQAVIGGLVAPLAYSTVERHFGRRPALIAGCIAALQPTFIFWARYLLTETFGLVLFAIAIERASALVDTPRRNAISVGLVGALNYLVRAAYAAPALAIYLVTIARGRPKGTRAATILLGAALALAVPVARNVVAIGEPVAYRDQGMLLVWMGSHWTIEGRATWGVDLIPPPGYESWSQRERAAYYRDDVFATLTGHPMEYAARTIGKVLWFWSPVFPEWSLAHKLFTGTYTSVLYVLAAVGLLRHWRSGLGMLLIAAALAVQVTVAATVVDYDNRYRIPLEYCLIPFAAAGAAALIARWTVRSTARRSQ